MGEIVDMEDRRKPKVQEISISVCAQCEGTAFLLAEEGQIYCARCIERVRARWWVPDNKDSA